jgi:hypothetical protein
MIKERNFVLTGFKQVVKLNLKEEPTIALLFSVDEKKVSCLYGIYFIDEGFLNHPRFIPCILKTYEIATPSL